MQVLCNNKMRSEFLFYQYFVSFLESLIGQLSPSTENVTTKTTAESEGITTKLLKSIQFCETATE